MAAYLMENLDLEVGVDLPTVKKDPVTHTQLVKFSGASGDFNPIHTVESAAKEAGLDGVIAHGMLIMGFAGEALTTWVPRASIQKFNVRFSAMTKPGDEIEVRGKLAKKVEQEDGILVEIKLQAVDQKEEVKVKGSCIALLSK